MVISEQRQRMFQKESLGMPGSMGTFKRFINWIVQGGVKEKRQQAPMIPENGEEEFMLPFPRLG